MAAAFVVPVDSFAILIRTSQGVHISTKPIFVVTAFLNKGTSFAIATPALPLTVAHHEAGAGLLP
ncbi:hypothetical protein D3C85_1586590 [compost metagenome]